ncbi:MAG: hypothetical protein R2730_11215 [Chitinophagales bacterium]
MQKTFKLIWFLLLPFICDAQIRDAQVNLYAIPIMSTSFIRMPSRSSSQEYDAVYFNPAGITALKDGFHLSVNNHFQFLDQRLEVTKLKQLQDQPQNYALQVGNYAFPMMYATYKKKDLAFSFFITPAIGGAGASTVKNLPFGEYPIADLTALSKGIIKTTVDQFHGTDYDNITYDYDFEFKGIAFSPSAQINMAYQINDYLSVAAGGRLIYYITQAAGGLSNLTFNNETYGLSLSPGNYVRSIADNVNLQYPELALTLADVLDQLPLELEIDSRQSDFAFTPIVGVNFNWKDKWNIGFKYEHKTKVLLRTDVFDGNDGAGAYVQDKIQPADLPGMFSIGLSFKPYENLTFAAGNRTFFFKRANLDGREQYVKSNYKEFEFAVQYEVFKKLIVSGGATYITADVDDKYFTSVDYFVPSLSAALGFKSILSKRISVETGFLITKRIPTKYTQDVDLFGGLANLVLGSDLPDFISESFNRRVDYEMSGNAYVVSLGVNFWMGSIEQNQRDRKERIERVQSERKRKKEERKSEKELSE